MSSVPRCHAPLRAVARQGRLLLLTLLAACGGGDSPAGGVTNPPPPPPPSVATVSVTPDSTTLRTGETVQLTATPRDAQGNAMSGQAVTWASGNAAVATVSAAGLVTAVGNGRVEITATAAGRSGVAVVVGRPVADTLAAGAAVLATAVIQDRPVARDTTHYRTDLPALPGMEVSMNTISVLLAPTATVGEVNALLVALQADIVGSIAGGAAGALLVLRLPTTSATQAEAARAQAAQRPFVLTASLDLRLRSTIVPRPNGGNPAGWSWDLARTGPNYGLELIGAPQLWNLNDYVRRNGAPATETGVFDVGFLPNTDVVPVTDLSGGFVHDHGIHVAGVIGATFDNGTGVDGVNPFAAMTFGSVTSGAQMATELVAFIGARPNMRVVNVSLGYNWYQRNISPIAPLLGAAARAQATRDGQILDWSLRVLQGRNGHLPVIVSAAGNDANATNAEEARYGSPFNAAALIHSNQAIVVVEAIDQTTAKAWFSNKQGHLSAPGVGIMSAGDPTQRPPADPVTGALTGPCGGSTTVSNTFARCSGTSMAAPHVAGLVSYLYSLAPSLPWASVTSNTVRDLLVVNAEATIGPSSPMINAFATALDVDRLLPGAPILRGLLDIDDGSPDGNLRVDQQGQVVTGEDYDGDGFQGDGQIDMSDFRRFRDALLLTELPQGLALDGGPVHAKRDLNRDRALGTVAAENTFPRADFNGDGGIDRFTAVMSGELDGQSLTDLGVLQSQFNDPHYQASQLPNLIDSGDIAVLLQQCAGLQGVATLRLQARVQNTNPIVQQRTVPATEVHQVLTLPVNSAGYTIAVDALNASGTVVAAAEGDLPVTLGGDAWFGPVCKELRITTTPLVLQGVPANVATPVTILVEERLPGAATWTRAAGATLRLTMTNGTLSSASGTTDSQGEAVVGVTWNGSAAGLLVIRARLAGGATGSAQLGVGSSPLSLPGGNLGSIPLNVAFSGGISASGGIPPYSYSIVGGALPPGLSLDGSTGAITGTPTLAGNYTFTVRVTAGGASATANYGLVVVGPGTPDPWLGNYRGTATGGGKQYLMNISLNFAYYAPGNYYNVAPLSVNDAVTNANLYLSYSCRIFGPPTLTTTTGSCPGGRAINVTRSTQVVNGVQLRVLTGTITNMTLDPANPTARVTLAFTLPEFIPP